MNIKIGFNLFPSKRVKRIVEIMNENYMSSYFDGFSDGYQKCMVDMEKTKRMLKNIQHG